MFLKKMNLAADVKNEHKKRNLLFVIFLAILAFIGVAIYIFKIKQPKKFDREARIRSMGERLY